MATRKDNRKMVKFSEVELLRVIADSNDAGWSYPANLAKESSSFKICAKIFDSGLVEMSTGAYGYYYTITEKGREVIANS
jgi:hypothetical protein